jgi:hypothetical protein
MALVESMRSEAATMTIAKKFPYIKEAWWVTQPIPVAERSKMRGRSLAGIAGSNPAEGKLCAFSDRGICDGPIPRPEASYIVWCHCV